MNTRYRWVTVGCAVVILGFAYKFMRTGLSKDERRLFSHFTQANSQENHLTLNSAKNIRLVSYNLWCDYLKPHSITSLNDRIEGLAEGIKDFDIALIQEAYIFKTGIAVFTKCASLLIAMMETRGFHYRTSIADFVAPYLGQSGGIVIFSRIPLARTTSRRYRNYSILQFYNYRGFVVGEYLFNSRHLYVVNTHLDPHGAATRTLQVKELAAELVPSTPSMEMRIRTLLWVGTLILTIITPLLVTAVRNIKSSYERWIKLVFGPFSRWQVRENNRKTKQKEQLSAVRFEYVRQNETICEGGRFDISCPDGKTIDVVEASYGRHDRETCFSSTAKDFDCHYVHSLASVAALMPRQTELQVLSNKRNYCWFLMGIRNWMIHVMEQGNICSSHTTAISSRYLSGDCGW
ncbi:hypothetical protein OS493_003472 [Desmophyllum pertusum]|uniref:Uncharacterized protein n=1 Tax=Desmophyllum pertusum TaxID=174260 RepID=A0A9X0DCK8_9CNID|nr:hypothetical protein OS493_003472 [Desmophyllum pertusum]